MKVFSKKKKINKRNAYPTPLLLPPACCRCSMPLKVTAIGSADIDPDKGRIRRLGAEKGYPASDG